MQVDRMQAHPPLGCHRQRREVGCRGEGPADPGWVALKRRGEVVRVLPSGPVPGGSDGVWAVALPSSGRMSQESAELVGRPSSARHSAASCGRVVTTGKPVSPRADTPARNGCRGTCSLPGRHPARIDAVWVGCRLSPRRGRRRSWRPFCLPGARDAVAAPVSGSERGTTWREQLGCHGSGLVGWGCYALSSSEPRGGDGWAAGR